MLPLFMTSEIETHLVSFLPKAESRRKQRVVSAFGFPLSAFDRDNCWRPLQQTSKLLLHDFLARL